MLTNSRSRVYVMCAFCMSTAPAQMLGLSRKGRLQVDFDADITVFDPSATTSMSAIRHVVVNGYVDVQACAAMYCSSYPQFAMT